MSFRLLLMGAMVAVLGIGLALSGAVITSMMHNSLLARVDENLRSAATGWARPAEPPPVHPPGAPSLTRPKSNYFIAIDRPDGERIIPVDEGGSRPDTTALTAGSGGPVTVHSVDSGPRWRLYRDDTPAGAVYIALPLTDLDTTIDTLITREIWIGSAILVAGAIAAYLLAGGALRPLHTIDTVASAIVTGESDHRVDASSPITEIRRLASSINGMLDRIHRSARAERTAKDTAVRSQENLRRFVADASHELRTPLTSIKGFSELHRLGACADTGVLMGRIEGEADRMSRLVDDLLLLARLDSQPHLDNRPVEVLALLADCLNSAKTLAPQRSINLHIATGAETVQVLGDATRLTQVVMNLLTNAIRHTPPHTDIDVAMNTNGEQAVIEVTDHGPGIPAADAAHLFERFYRSDTSRTRATGGNGLGLSIAAAIVTAHTGQIELDTDTTGSTFRVALPVFEPGGHDGSDE